MHTEYLEFFEHNKGNKSKWLEKFNAYVAECEIQKVAFYCPSHIPDGEVIIKNMTIHGMIFNHSAENGKFSLFFEGCKFAKQTADNFCKLTVGKNCQKMMLSNCFITENLANLAIAVESNCELKVTNLMAHEVDSKCIIKLCQQPNKLVLDRLSNFRVEGEGEFQSKEESAAKASTEIYLQDCQMSSIKFINWTIRFVNCDKKVRFFDVPYLFNCEIVHSCEWGNHRTYRNCSWTPEVVPYLNQMKRYASKTEDDSSLQLFRALELNAKRKMLLKNGEYFVWVISILYYLTSWYSLSIKRVLISLLCLFIVFSIYSYEFDLCTLKQNPLGVVLEQFSYALKHIVQPFSIFKEAVNNVNIGGGRKILTTFYSMAQLSLLALLVFSTRQRFRKS